jgi:hypothetical protein
MARYRSRSRRTRRNGGVRRTGALIINGTRKRSKRRARRSSPRVMYLRPRSNGRRRTKRRSKRRSTRRNGWRRAGSLSIRTNGRRRRSRRRVRRNPRRRVSVRSHLRRRKGGRGRARRNGWRRAGSLSIRTNGRRRSRRTGRRRGRSRRNGSGGTAFAFNLPFAGTLKRMVGRLPFIGGPLAGAIALSGASALGAVSVIPTTLLAQFIGPYVPNLNSSIFYALAGLGLAGFFGSTKFLGAGFHKALAIATAAAGGAVAVYKWQTGDDAPMAAETGRLLISSPVAGFGAAILGNRHIAGYGPMAVRPMVTPYGY